MVGIKSSELSSLTISKIWRHMPVNKQKYQLWIAKHHMYNCYQRLHQEVHNNSLSMFKLCWFYIYWCLSHYLKREHGLNGDLMIIGVCWEKIGKSCKLCPVRFPSHESALCQEAHTHTSHGQRSPTQVIMGTLVSVFTGLLGAGSNLQNVLLMCHCQPNILRSDLKACACYYIIPWYVGKWLSEIPEIWMVAQLACQPHIKHTKISTVSKYNKQNHFLPSSLKLSDIREKVEEK